MNGAGEMLVFSAADFEDFLEPRPDLPPVMEEELDRGGPPPGGEPLAVPPPRHLRRVDLPLPRRLRGGQPGGPLQGLALVLRPCRDHHPAEPGAGQGALAAASPSRTGWPSRGNTSWTATGKQAAEQTPPVRRMLEMGIPVGAGTDATRVASYNPWVSLYWLVTGRTVGGTAALPGGEPPGPDGGAAALHAREAAGSPARKERRGRLSPGQLADLAVLSADYFTVPEEEIKGIESVLTIVGGKVVYGAAEFGSLAPPPLPVSPDWSPVGVYGGYHRGTGGYRGNP